ncbi:MAG: hypothetical protein R3F37_06655 [Candidatus Competibacteraceae bacterium]
MLVYVFAHDLDRPDGLGIIRLQFNLLGNEATQRTYLLDAQLSLGPADFSSRKTLLVAEPRAEAGFDTPRIAVRRRRH